MRKQEDLAGQIFNYLKVLYKDDEHEKLRKEKQRKHEYFQSKWICKCLLCGKLKSVGATELKRGDTKTCGNHKITDTKKHNKYNLIGEYGIGWTSNTNQKFYFDLEDYDKIKEYTWYEGENKYIKTSYWDKKDKKQGTFYLHQFITNFQYKMIDHKDRNPYNNRKNNLREVNYQNNNYNKGISKRNKSGIIGVFLASNYNNKKWEAVISDPNYKEHGFKRKKVILGYFDELEDAIYARLKAEQECYGIFAPQRNLFEKYKIFFPENV